MWNYLPELFTEDETEILSRYFTNIDKPVFALVNLPEVVKGALFARYSRSAKSLRRLFLDEFYDQVDLGSSDLVDQTVGVVRAAQLYERMLAEYGDDSVAQLGGVHLACEQASNILTKILERGRLMAYLEQSTRYVPYDKVRSDGNYKYYVPTEIANAGMESLYRQQMDVLFREYAELYQLIEGDLIESTVKDEGDSESVYRSSIRAVALDAVRGLLPVSVLSNIGIFGSAQAFEYLILRLRSSRYVEAQQYAELIKGELDKVIPAFLTRLDRVDRGQVWVEYLKSKNECLEGFGVDSKRELAPVEVETDEVRVRLLKFDPNGERRIAAGILFSRSQISYGDALESADSLTDAQLSDLFDRYVGLRQNRRHKPGRAFEETDYLFEIECDYGAFRDLQRHRLLSIEWQQLDTLLGYSIPELIVDFGYQNKFVSLLESSQEFYRQLREKFGIEVASYAVPMAFRIRFTLGINAREALHLIELRSSPQGHTTYRKVALEMYDCINNLACHTNIARSMKFVDMGHYRLGRLSSFRHEEMKSKDLSNQN